MPLTKVEGPSLGNVTITNLTTSTSANVSTLTVGANVTINTSTVFVGNSTANVIHTGSALTVGANVTMNATTVFVGNSSVNTSITAGSVLVNGAAVGGGGSNTGGNGAVQFWSTTTNAIASSANLLFSGTTLTITANVIPGTNATHNLGNTTMRWSTVYTADLDLKNDIGDWTIVEGADDLFIYNNKRGKVYKFNLVEVDPTVAPPKKV